MVSKSKIKTAGKIRSDPIPTAKTTGGAKTWRDFSLACLIVLIIFMAYIPATKAGFIWDDDTFLTENPLIKAPDGLFRFWFSTEPPDYFPLTSTTLWFEWRLWGMNAAGYHVVNIILHCLNTILLWLVLRELKIPGAWLAALLFGIHPVCVESVAWVTERKNTLPLVFFMLSLLLFLKSEKSGKPRLYMLSLFSFLLALLSKTSVITLPVILLGCLWWMNGKVSFKDFKRIAPYFVLSAVLGLVTIWFQYNRAIGEEVVRNDGFASRLAISGRAVWFYLYKAILPVNLSFVYPRWEIGATSLLSYIPLALIVLCVGVFWMERSSWGRGILFGFGYYLIMLLPILGFLNIYFMKYSLVADHWQYIALPGLIALAVGSIAHYYSKSGKEMKRIGQVAAVIISGAFFGLTFKQGQIYRNQETLWEDTLHKNPSSWLALNNLGKSLFDRGKTEDAIVLYRKSISLKPDDDVAYNDMGAALLKQGKAEEALGYFQKAVERNPGYEVNLCNLGNTLSGLGRKQEAIRYFFKAVVAAPDSPAPHFYLGNTYLELGRKEEALKHYKMVVQMSPSFAKPHQKLGEIYYSLCRFGESIEHYRKAITIQPQWLDVKSDLAWVLSTIEDEKFRNGAEAVKLAEEVCRKENFRNPMHLDTLAAACAAAGRFPEAVETVQKALRIVESAGAKNLAGIMKKRLEAYQSGRPWLENPKPR